MTCITQDHQIDKNFQFVYKLNALISHILELWCLTKMIVAQVTKQQIRTGTILYTGKKKSLELSTLARYAIFVWSPISHCMLCGKIKSHMSMFVLRGGIISMLMDIFFRLNQKPHICPNHFLKNRKQTRDNSDLRSRPQNNLWRHIIIILRMRYSFSFNRIFVSFFSCCCRYICGFRLFCRQKYEIE